MDPDGTIYYLINLTISFILCLYSGAKLKMEQDEDFPLGVSPSQVSAVMLMLANIWAMATYALPTFRFPLNIVLAVVFAVVATFLPYCVGLAVSEDLTFITKLLSPLITVLNSTLALIVMLPVHIIFGLFKLNAEDEVTAQDVMDLVEDAHEDVIDDDQKEMIENIFELDDMTAGDIMTHRTDVFAFNGKDKCADIVEQAVESGFSRIPVYDGTIDTIAGILYTKDLLTVVGDDEKLAQPVKTYVRKAMFVPEACAARELLVQFKLTRNQMAVVVDEYGGTSGIITMEDILEEIVGNIQDEYDDEDEMYSQNEDGSYTCNASMELEDLLELFDIEVDEEELEEGDFDSIGGLIIDRLGRIPSSEEAASVEYKGLVFIVTDVADRRILKVKVERKYPIA